jgi:glycosyltransferase involved in cell wall biosynthesis
MKIVHILVSKANPNTMSGVNKVVHCLATAQRRQGDDVEVWGIVAAPDVVHHEHEYSLRLFQRSSLRFVLDEELKQSIDALKFDSIIHFHSVFIPEFFAITRRLIRKGISWVITPHGGYTDEILSKNGFIKAIYLNLFEKNVVKGAKIVQAVGEGEILEVKKISKESKVILVPNGLDFDELAFTEKFIERKFRPVFGFCGRLVTRAKGLDLLIKGFSKYRKNGGLGRLWIIGDGPDKDSLKKLCTNLAVGNDVKFLGSKFGEEKYNLLKNLDVFVSTSRSDGLPLSVLEAAGLGLPLLISKETNMASYLRHWNCGFALEENTPVEIANAMELMHGLFEKGELLSMGEKARALAETEFQWPKIANTLVESLYQPNIRLK